MADDVVFQTEFTVGAATQNTAERNGKKHAWAYIVRPYSHKLLLLPGFQGDDKIAITLYELVQN